MADVNETVRKWSTVYKALRNSAVKNNSIMNNFEMAFNNAKNNFTHSNEQAAREHFISHPNKRKYIKAAWNKLMESKKPAKPRTPAKSPTKLKKFVNRAIVQNAIMTYVTNPAKLKDPNFKYRYKALVNYMKNNPINIPNPLYRGVPKTARYMPAKGYYNSEGRFLSFAKRPNTAKFFAGPGGTVFVLPPGKYPAFNINANVKKRYPNVKTHRNANKYPKLVRNYIGYARAEDEIMFAPGVFRVGNVRNSNNKTRIYKNIYFHA
jgi:hypothetical protein